MNEGISITGAMQITYKSDHFNMTFWLDTYGDMMATSFDDCDYENVGYVSEWADEEHRENVLELIKIKNELIRANAFVGNLPKYIQEADTLENMYKNPELTIKLPKKMTIDFKNKTIN